MTEHENVVSGDGKEVRCTYWSLDEYAEAAERRSTQGELGWRKRLDGDTDWRGGTFNDALKLARFGWEDKLQTALDIAESALDYTVREHEIDSFVSTYDYAGCEVDVARYLTGVPENMIDYPLQATSKLGRVITLCGSIAASGAMDPEDLIRRGQVITAFAMALTRLGHACELWIDCTISADWNRAAGATRGVTRVLVKGTNDTIDPARILFAYAHPGSLRSLGFAVTHAYPEKFSSALGIGGIYGYPADPIEDLPEGTIYLPSVLTGKTKPDAHEELKDLLRQAGLLHEDVDA